MQGGSGLGNPDAVQSLEYFKLAAVRGHPDSIYNVGVFTMNGYGTEAEIPAGLKMIRLAVDANPSLKMPPPLKGLDSNELDRFVEVCEKVERKEEETGRAFLDRMVVLVKLESKRDGMKEVKDEVKVDESLKKEVHVKEERSVANDTYAVFGGSIAVLAVVMGVGYLMRRTLS